MRHGLRYKIAFAKFGSVVVRIYIKLFDDVVMLPVHFKVDTVQGQEIYEMVSDSPITA